MSNKNWNLANKDRIAEYNKQYRQNMSVEQKAKYAKAAKAKYETTDGFLKDKNLQLKRYYSITIEEYNTLFTNQNGECKICNRHQSEFKKALSVDHDHETGEIRGLLCNSCNRGIGYLQDSIELLANAIQYLNKNN